MRRRNWVALGIAAAAGLMASHSAKADWLVQTYQSGTLITNYQTADALIGGFHLTSVMPWTTGLLNTQDNNSTNNVTGIPNTGTQIPGLPAGDNNDFVTTAAGTLTASAAGAYIFSNNTDDGSRLRISINGGPFNQVISDNVLSGPHTVSSAPINLNAGDTVAVDWMWFERGGGAEGVNFYTFNGGANTVTGDPAGALVPSGPFVVNTYKSQGNIPNINSFNDADPIRVPANLAGSAVRKTFNILNDSAAGANGGDFGGNDPVPGIGSDLDDFVVYGTGYLVVGAGQGGHYTFRSNTDDGGRLKIDLDGNGTFDPADLVINQDVLQGPTNSDSASINLAPGMYKIEYSWFERGGGAEGEVSARFDDAPSSFILLGDTASGGLDVVQAIPEPAGLSLLALGGLALLSRRRRTK